MLGLENKVIAQENRERILNVLYQDKYCRFKDLREKTGLTDPTLSKWLPRLEREGIVKRVILEGKKGVYYTLSEKFKETDYYQMKALALKEFLDLRKFIDDGGDLMFEKIGKTIFIFAFLAWSDKHKPEKYNIALSSYVRLLSMYLAGKVKPINEIVKQSLDRIRKPIESYTKHDIERLLNTVENEKEREQIKKVLFST